MISFFFSMNRVTFGIRKEGYEEEEEEEDARDD